MAIRKQVVSNTNNDPSDEKIISAMVHIIGIFVWFIPSLVVYLTAEDKFTKDNARNALNWQISALIYVVISFILIIVLIGLLFLALIFLANLIFCIVAAIKASQGKAWKYPAAINLIN